MWQNTCHYESKIFPWSFQKRGCFYTQISKRALVEAQFSLSFQNVGSAMSNYINPFIIHRLGNPGDDSRGNTRKAVIWWACSSVIDFRFWRFWLFTHILKVLNLHIHAAVSPKVWTNDCNLSVCLSILIILVRRNHNATAYNDI